LRTATTPTANPDEAPTKSARTSETIERPLVGCNYTVAPGGMTRALLVYPQFRSASFWNYTETCKLMDGRYPAAPLGLCTVAAMLPADWEVRLLDRNVDEWDESLLDWADVVLTGGMMPQQRDCLELIHTVRTKGKRVIVGGPDATSSPHLYAEADHLVLGEGEVTVPQFLADFAAGTARKTYQDPRKADVQSSPVPRFDLLQFRKYNHIGVQWCRGCPFQCEFCDIIELFGRVPRAKSTPQILKELQTLYDLGYRGHVDLVDDNFIGNKKLVKLFLPDLKVWLQERRWPFEFTTEASINLADDAELMQLMRDVGFFAIFVGIESPDEATLVAMQKRQNTHRSISESIEKIYAHGMFVNAGFILGFDNEKGSVARGIIECIDATSIPVAMAGLLTALPTTQLTRRLATAGRLPADFDVVPDGGGDQCTAGLNFVTLRPRAEILADYLQVIETIYSPANYFARVARVGRRLDSSTRRFKPAWGHWLREMKAFTRLTLKLGFARATCGPFWRTVLASLWRNPKSIRYTGALIALYLHFGPFSRYVATRIRAALAAETAKAAVVPVAKVDLAASG
jgi:hypothetical protein